MIHTNHISTTPASTSDFSSAIDRGTVPRAKSEEKSEVLAGVVEIMLTVNYSHSGEVLRLLGTSPHVACGCGHVSTLTEAEKQPRKRAEIDDIRS